MSDVVVDATPEVGQAFAAFSRHQTSTQRQPGVPENQESLEKHMQVKCKLSDERNLPTQSDHLADFDEDEFTPYNDWFPEELKKKPNIAIINTDEDQEGAHAMKVFIENKVHLEIGGKRFWPRVELLEKITLDLRVDPLDYALEKVDYLFVYITPNFSDSYWNTFQSRSSLRAILSKHNNTQCSLVCVHTDSERKKLPANLFNANHLDYWDEKLEQFTDDVRKYFRQISYRLIKERDALTVLRNKYMDENSQMTKQETSIDRSEIPNQKGKLTETGKFSHNQTCQPSMSSKGRTTRTVKQRSRANVEERDTETCKWTSEKDISLEDSNQVGMRSESDCNKSCYSSSVKTSTVEHSSLAEPSDDKAVPENPNPNAFTTTESDVSHTGSHNLPTGQRNTYSHREVSDIVSEDGSHPNNNEHIQSVSYNTAPNISVNSSDNSFEASLNNPAQEEALLNNPAREVPRNSSSRRRWSENTSTISGSQVHIHIHQATNVAIGKYSQINISPISSVNEDNDNSEDSENGHSYEI